MDAFREKYEKNASSRFAFAPIQKLPYPPVIQVHSSSSVEEEPPFFISYIAQADHRYMCRCTVQVQVTGERC